MKTLGPAVTAMVLMLAAPANATQADAGDLDVGVSLGGAMVGAPTNAAGQFNSNFQWCSGMHFRGEPAGPFSEATLGLISRNQALGVNREKVFDTAGLSIGLGAKFGFLHAGVAGEATLLREIVQDTSIPGFGLRFHNGAGVLVEPYLGVALPFFKSEASNLEISLHYPIPALNFVDPAIGPRLQFTLWISPPPPAPSDEDEKLPDENDGKGDESAIPAPAIQAPAAPPPKAKGAATSPRHARPRKK